MKYWFLSLFTVVFLNVLPATGFASNHLSYRSYNGFKRVVVNHSRPRSVYLVFPTVRSSAILRVR